MPLEQQTTEEIHKRLSSEDRCIELHREAINNGMNLSRYLEAIDPTPKGERLDAFERQLRESDLVVQSNPQAGWWSNPAEDFLRDSAGRALFAEWYARTWRSVAYAPRQRANSIILSGDWALGSTERPWPDAGQPAWQNQIVPAIPLNELVAMTTPIGGEGFKRLYMTYDAAAVRLYRIGETAEMPMANLTTSEREYKLRKYGRGLRISYEALRRQRIDKIAWWVRWQALQAEVDKVTAAMDYLISGDGNAGTAATSYNLTTLDPTATPGELSLTGWLNFRLQFAQPYIPTTALMTQAVALQLILLNTGSANIPLQGANFNGIGNQLTPINVTADAIRYGWTADAPSNKIVAFDNRTALEQVVEIGSEIRETERFITNQTEVMVMTENSAFAVLDANGTKILNLAA